MSSLRNLNKVILIGTCASEPEIRTESPTYKLVQFTLAVENNRMSQDYNSGSSVQTDWHRIVCWNRNADYVLNNIHNGHRVYVEGKLHSYSYQDKSSGNQVRTYEINADQVLNLTEQGNFAPNYSQPQMQRPNGGWGNGDDNYGGSFQNSQGSDFQGSAYTNGGGAPNQGFNPMPQESYNYSAGPQGAGSYDANQGFNAQPFGNQGPNSFGGGTPFASNNNGQRSNNNNGSNEGNGGNIGNNDDVPF